MPPRCRRSPPARTSRVPRASTIPPPARRHITAPSTSDRSRRCRQPAHGQPHTQPCVCHLLRCADKGLGTSWCHCFYLADNPTAANDRHLCRFNDHLCAPRAAPTAVRSQRRHRAGQHQHEQDQRHEIAATSPCARRFNEQNLRRRSVETTRIQRARSGGHITTSNARWREIPVRRSRLNAGQSAHTRAMNMQVTDARGTVFVTGFKVAADDPIPLSFLKYLLCDQDHCRDYGSKQKTTDASSN